MKIVANKAVKEQGRKMSNTGGAIPANNTDGG